MFGVAYRCGRISCGTTAFSNVYNHHWERPIIAAFKTKPDIHRTTTNTKQVSVSDLRLAGVEKINRRSYSLPSSQLAYVAAIKLIRLYLSLASLWMVPTEVYLSSGAPDVVHGLRFRFRRCFRDKIFSLYSSESLALSQTPLPGVPSACFVWHLPQGPVRFGWTCQEHKVSADIAPGIVRRRKPPRQGKAHALRVETKGGPLSTCTLLFLADRVAMYKNKQMRVLHFFRIRGGEEGRTSCS